MAASKLDKCFLCNLFGNMEEFQYIKNQFNAQHTCDKRYNCDICDKKHNSNEELQSHKNNSHFAGNDNNKTQADEEMQNSNKINMIVPKILKIENDKSQQPSPLKHKVNSQNSKNVSQDHKIHSADAFDRQGLQKEHKKFVYTKKSNSSDQSIGDEIDSVHEGEKEHKCESCGKLFSRAEHLKRHINAVHEGNQDHKCEFCLKSFSQAGYLKKHIHTIHEDQKY